MATSRKLELELENRIVREAAKGLLAAGYSLEAVEAEGIGPRTRSLSVILTRLNEDNEWLRVWKGQNQVGWVRLVWGNVQDIISDYTVNLEEPLKDALALANEYSD